MPDEFKADLLLDIDFGDLPLHLSFDDSGCDALLWKLLVSHRAQRYYYDLLL